ncbi:mitochondrial amidoxime-reducing component 1 [Corythoichthys intestinalis]|uniref:mitochondrial amidoxime-reducing component 1 n=1 Tax=Corythoichthys intestinalis TaxID=161448 RepID=UPI0025A6392B|nr:mitochondrial amidoxime-reducing component 1 [Corythoichthys intestinalis]XP_061798915.1 mitochondrial amidoxime-reducing component 1-like [Nerophis lumbriciformis]
METWEAVKALSQNNKLTHVLVGTAAAAVLALGVGYKYWRKSETHVRVGVVSQLLIHPLKSGKAASVPLAECLKKGLKCGEMQDRHWMVVTEDGHMVTGRQEPRLVLVSLTCEGGQVCLNGPDMAELRFPIEQPNNAVMDCRVFSADIQGRDCGDQASCWLVRYLQADKTFRLVHFEPQMRARRFVEAEPLYSQKKEVVYPDCGPVMLLSEASVKDLSGKLDKDVTVERFRPNIVIDDCEAFAEDSWDEIQIGSVRLRRVMSCGRCIFTTVDPETGIINRKEPLETLKSYRQCKPHEKHIYKSAPLFGQLLSVEKTGVMQVGDHVYKISR